MGHYQVWVNDWDLHNIIAESKEDAKRQVREWLGLERLRATVIEISPGYYDGIKGEWKVSSKSFNDNDVGGNLVIRSNQGIVAMACTIHEGLINAEANANLLAAAPDLYEALTEASVFVKVMKDDRVMFKIQQALAKAEGK